MSDDRFSLGNSPDEMKMRELLLHWRKIAGRAEITPQLAHDMDARMYQNTLAMMGDRIVLDIQSKVLGEVIEHEDREVEFRQEAKPPPIEITIQASPLYVRLLAMAPFFSGAVGGAVAAVLTSWLWAFVAIACVAAIDVIQTRTAARTETIEPPPMFIDGKVTIGADYWHTFPKNTRVYPPELGSVVRMIEYTTPDVCFFKPEGGER